MSMHNLVVKTIVTYLFTPDAEQHLASGLNVI